MSNKVCKTCKEEKPKNGFHKSKRHVDGILKECRVCYNKKILKMKKDNPEFLEKTRNNAKKYKKNNKEKRRLAGIKYREENKEKIKESNKKYRINNKKKIKASKLAYEKKNPQIRAKIKIKRRTSESRSIPSWAEHDKIKTIYEKAKWLESITGLKYHVDHIVPLQGKNVCGLHVWENLQILEASVNCSKGNKHD